MLDAIARTLRLDDAERAHLMRLAHEADGSNAVLRTPRRPKQWQVRPSLQWSLDAITAPAGIGNDRLDTSALTAAASNTSTITSSATSPSPMRVSTYAPSPA